MESSGRRWGGSSIRCSRSVRIDPRDASRRAPCASQEFVQIVERGAEIGAVVPCQEFDDGIGDFMCLRSVPENVDDRDEQAVILLDN